MWLLESEGAFDGRRLWLRPGKVYLFGRTASEPGQLAISHTTISRKHLTITVDEVESQSSHRLSSRSKLTLEDLATKIGTVVNGRKIRGSKFVAEDDDLEFIMGKCPSKFRIIWFPVVFTFSFTSKELQTDPLAMLRQRFEHLDIKLSTDYSIEHTTHVVSRKRNTAKGLQALINGKNVVTETFLEAISQAAQTNNDTEPSFLEQDFGRYWPNAMEHLPPRGGEPVQHPDSIYAPDVDRKDVFEGYTFIFYDKTQYSNLMAPILNGAGKALLQTVVPGETQVDDFVRYVKEVAGEKGLGSFEDGSEGKGVVLVRFLPAKGDQIIWYTDFITEVSLRLDHRPIEQNEFLEAILIKDASKLRRPLEVESAPPSQVAAPAAPPPSLTEHTPDSQAEQATDEYQSVQKRNRNRGPVKRRFAGFDDDADIDMNEPLSLLPAAPAATESAPNPEHEDEPGLFVSQEPDVSVSQPPPETHAGSLKKRRAFGDNDLMDGMAPAAARFKRQRLEQGREFASPSPEPKRQVSQPVAGKKKGNMDVLAMAAQNREEEEARARAEQEDLANLPEGIDLAEIRRLNIVEEMDVRILGQESRSRDQDITNGRWNPKWNGIKNFKKFRRRGETTGRQPIKTIIDLQQVKTKEYGIGDNYWLEDESVGRKNSLTSARSNRTTQNSIPSTTESSSRKRDAHIVISESEEENVEESSGVGRRTDPGATSSTKIPATPSQLDSTVSSSRQTRATQQKRPAPDSSSDQRAKKPRSTLRAVEIGDSDESEDELKFRFGKRR